MKKLARLCLAVVAFSALSVSGLVFEGPVPVYAAETVFEATSAGVKKTSCLFGWDGVMSPTPARLRYKCYQSAASAAAYVYSHPGNGTAEPTAGILIAIGGSGRVFSNCSPNPSYPSVSSQWSGAVNQLAADGTRYFEGEVFVSHWYNYGGGQTPLSQMTINPSGVRCSLGESQRNGDVSDVSRGSVPTWEGASHSTVPLSVFEQNNPPKRFGEAYTIPPSNPCENFFPIYFTVSDDGGPWQTRMTLLGSTIGPGDRVKFETAGTTYPDQAVSFSTRFNKADPYKLVAGWEPFVSLQEPVVGISTWPFPGATIKLDDFSVRCSSEGFDDVFFTIEGGWEDAPATGDTSICDSYTIAVSTSRNGGTSYEPLTTVERGYLVEGDSIRFEIALKPGENPQIAAYTFRYDPNGVWYQITTVGSPSVFPVVIDKLVNPDEAPVQMLDAQFKCTSNEGVERIVGLNGVPPGGGTGDESCFTFEGMTLTNPASWVKGAGRMVSCLLVLLFVPDGEQIQEAWDGVKLSADEGVPVSWVTNGLTMSRDAVDGIDSSVSGNSTGCLGWFDTEAFQLPADWGCLSDKLAGTSWPGIRVWLARFVWLFFGLWVLSEAMAIINGYREGGVDSYYVG